MAISCFARFKGGFAAPTVEGGPEGLERDLEELAVYLARELPAQGIDCSEPEWADVEYQIDCRASDRWYQLSVSFDYLEWEWFELSYQPNLGFVGRLFGRSEEAEMARLSGALDAVLRRREGVVDLRWYRKALDDPDEGFAQHPEGVPS